MGDPDKEKVYVNAIREMREQGLSVRKAAKKWGIAKSTLQDRLDGKVAKVRKGPPTVLTKAEEDRFAEWLIERAKRGFGVTKDEFLDCVKTFIDKDKRKTKFTGNRPGNKWYRGFVKRNPKVRLRNARPLDKKRAKITPKDVDEWFANFGKFVEEVGVSDRPGQIWNCDETGFDLQGRAGKVLGPSNTKEQPFRVITGTKEHITVLPCFNASGQCIPPYMLFAGKRIPNLYNLLDGAVPGSCYSMTEKGYMDTPSFYLWLDKHFIPNIPPARPVVLLVDSAEAHIDLDAFELAKKNGVFIYALLKNATHLVQPADVGLFGAMKQSWYKNVRRYSQQNPNTDITKKNFSSIFKKTWEDVMRPSILIDAFRKSGVYPVNRQQISHDQVRPSVVYDGTSTVTAPAEPSTSTSVFAEQEAALALTSLFNHQQGTSLGLMLPQQSVTAVNHLPVPEQTAPLGAISSQQSANFLSSLPVPQQTVPFGAMSSQQSANFLSSLPVPQQTVPFGAMSSQQSANFLSSLPVPQQTVPFGAMSSQQSANFLSSLPVPQQTVPLGAMSSQQSVNFSCSLPVSEQTTPLGAISAQQSTNVLNSLPLSEQTAPLGATPLTSTEVSSVLQEVLTYPSIPQSNASKNKKRSLPNFMNSEESLRIMRDEKLKKARELASKQKKLREREEKKEAKKREKEEKKRKMEEKRREKEKSKTNKTKRRQVSKRNSGKQWRQNLPLGENNCKVCLCEYNEDDDENMPWVMCDKCQSWMHIDCIPFGVDVSSIYSQESFFCHDCT